MKSLPYYDDLTARQTIKLRELIKTLPPFAKEFFRAIDSTTQVRTRIAYAYDLKIFFHFLQEKYPDIDVTLTTGTPVLACYLGPGLVGIIFESA